MSPTNTSRSPHNQERFGSDKKVSGRKKSPSWHGYSLQQASMGKVKSSVLYTLMPSLRFVAVVHHSQLDWASTPTISRQPASTSFNQLQPTLVCHSLPGSVLHGPLDPQSQAPSFFTHASRSLNHGSGGSSSCTVRSPSRTDRSRMTLVSATLVISNQIESNQIVTTGRTKPKQLGS